MNQPLYDPKNMIEMRWQAYKSFIWFVFMLLVLASFVLAMWLAIYQTLSFLIPFFWGVLFLIGSLSHVAPMKKEEKPSQ